MRVRIGNKTLEQIDGSDCDNIIFIDKESKKEYSFDEYLELINNEKK